ncbi:hypothetical protein CK203_045641 [Vitis vinifera]|uniref:Uncharacterized protein n=1 Tax=Vitis vinifera TaxID=29760 RepID=A0A438HQ68_VITVI|nr:hypothetical protein CK203_045641 [Vitis vinifera]
MGNQKQKSSDIEKEFMAMNDGNGEDTDPESPLGFSLFEPPIFGHPNQRNVARSSMDKGKSKMVATLGKLPVKRTRSVRARTLSNFPASPATPSEQHAVVQSTIAKAPDPTLVTKFAPPPSPTTSVPIHESTEEEISHWCKGRLLRREQILEALFRIISGQWWTPADLFMAALFYLEDKVHLKQLQRAKKYPLFFPRMLGTILEYYGFPTEPDKEKKHHCREVYVVSRWQGSVTKTESTLTSASFTTDNEHHYVPHSNLILEDFGNGEDTPPRPLAATTLGATSTLPNPDTVAHILANLSSTPKHRPISF